MIPYARQDISEADIRAVVETLRSDYLTQGPTVPKFERSVAGYCGAKFAVAVNSGTSALHIACLALDVGPGDWVWTTPITFVGSANCALYCGAKVDFVDIDPKTYNLSVAKLAEKLASAEQIGCLPKVVIPVHLAGQSCEMEAIRALSRRYGFKVIEDASHAIGGQYRGAPVGNCAHSDVTVFSFHPVKIITTAEGGIATTNDRVLAERLALFRSHGITRDPAAMTRVPDGPWYYEQIELGFNYRMTEVHAALGLSQLLRIDEFVARRHEVASYYDNALQDLPLVTPFTHPDAHSALHLYVIRLHHSAPVTHREVFDGMLAAGIGVNLHYIPVYRHPFYERFGFDRANFFEAERYYQEAITIPMFPTISQDDLSRVVAALTACIGKRKGSATSQASTR